MSATKEFSAKVAAKLAADLAPSNLVARAIVGAIVGTVALAGTALHKWAVEPRVQARYIRKWMGEGMAFPHMEAMVVGARWATTDNEAQALIYDFLVKEKMAIPERYVRFVPKKAPAAQAASAQA